MVHALALRSGDPGFKTCSDHWLNLFLVVPGSTSEPHFLIAICLASGQLGFLTVVVTCSVLLQLCLIGSEKSLWGVVN